MLNFENLKTGAARTRRDARANPMERLVQLIEADPTADNDRLFRQWMEIVEGDDELLKTALRHTFTNYMTTLERDRRKPRPRTAPASKAERDEAVKEIKARVEKLVLLNLIMPNGKKARYCKGTEMVKFGGKWAEAGKKAGNRLMGQAFTEDQLRKIMA